MNKHKLAILALAALGATTAHAVPVEVVNNDAAGVGLNDTSARAPVGGNEATTLGGQRVNVIERAARIIGNTVAGTVPIRIDAESRNDLPCTGFGGTLATGGSTFVFRNFDGAPQADTYYPVALANQLAGEDLVPADNPNGDSDADIDVNINRNAGMSGCLNGDVYYGLDGDVPPGAVNLLSVVVHELIHGLGFTSALNTQTGVFSIGDPTSFDRLIKIDDDGRDLGRFVDLSPSERLEAATNGRGDYLYIAGENSMRGMEELLVAGASDAPGPGLYTPSTIESSSSISHWATDLVPDQIMEPRTTFNQRPTQTLGLATCALADIGWTLAPGSSCPDTTNDALITIWDKYLGFSINADEGDVVENNTIVFSTDGDTVDITAVETNNDVFTIESTNCLDQPIDLLDFCGISLNLDPEAAPGRYRGKLTVIYADGRTLQSSLIADVENSNGNVPGVTDTNGPDNGSDEDNNLGGGTGDDPAGPNGPASGDNGDTDSDGGTEPNAPESGDGDNAANDSDSDAGDSSDSASEPVASTSGGSDDDGGSGGGGCSMASTPQPLDPTLLSLFASAFGVLVWRRRRNADDAEPNES